MDGRSLEHRVVMEVIGAIERKNPDVSTLHHVPEPGRALLATVTARGVIGNGGHRYWYEGKTDRDTLQTADAFDALGLPDAGLALRRSLDGFPGRKASPRIFAELDESTMAAAQRLWAPLDKVVWRCDWQRAALAYTLRHARAFAALDRRARLAIAELKDGWTRVRAQLTTGLEHAGKANRAAVRRALDADDHHTAHRLLRRAGAGAGHESAFWTALHEAAETLGVDDDGQSRREHALLRGYLLVRVEVVKANKEGVRHLDEGPARWNLGRRRRPRDTHETEVFPIGDEDFPDSIYDAGEVRLVPAHPLAPGTTIAIHRDGVVLAVGEVTEIVPAR